MPPRVLVLTPDSHLGETVRRALLDAGECQAVLAYNCRQANRFARQVVFDLAILDEDTPDEGLPELVHCLKEVQPRLSILTFQAQGVLKPADKVPPASAADPIVLRAVEEALRSYSRGRSQMQPEAAASLPGKVPPALESAGWFNDPSQAAEWLRRGLKYCQPQPAVIEAVILIRRASLWASAGQFTSQQVSAAAQLLVQSWTRELDPGAGEAAQFSGDMARYIRLNPALEFLLYARALGFGMVLGLALRPAATVSTARRLAGEFVHWLQAATAQDQAQSGPPAAQAPVMPELAVISPEPKFELEDVPPPTPEQVRGSLPQAGHMVWPWELDEDDPGLEAGR